MMSSIIAHPHVRSESHANFVAASRGKGGGGGGGIHLGDDSATRGQVTVQGGSSLAREDDEVPIATVQALAGCVDVQGAVMGSEDLGADWEGGDVNAVVEALPVRTGTKGVVDIVEGGDDGDVEARACTWHVHATWPVGTARASWGAHSRGCTCSMVAFHQCWPL